MAENSFRGMTGVVSDRSFESFGNRFVGEGLETDVDYRESEVDGVLQWIDEADAVNRPLAGQALAGLSLLTAVLLLLLYTGVLGV